MADFTTAVTPVHVRYEYDETPSWAAASAPSEALASLGRATGVRDRAQRTAIASDARGNAVWTARQIAVISDEVALTGTVAADGRPSFTSAGEGAIATASVLFDEDHTYVRTSTFDHAGRATSATLPTDPDFAPAPAPVVKGSLLYNRTGAPWRAELSIDGASRPVLSNVTDTRDGLVARTQHGDPRQTASTTLYNGRRQPVEMTTTRVPVAGTPAGTLGAVSTPNQIDRNENLVGGAVSQVEEKPEFAGVAAKACPALGVAVTGAAVLAPAMSTVVAGSTEGTLGTAKATAAKGLIGSAIGMWSSNLNQSSERGKDMSDVSLTRTAVAWVAGYLGTAGPGGIAGGALVDTVAQCVDNLLAGNKLDKGLVFFGLNDARDAGRMSQHARLLWDDAAAVIPAAVENLTSALIGVFAGDDDE